MQNKYTVSVGGIIRVANGCKIRDGNIIGTGLPKKIWALFQVNEYFRSFLAGRIVLNRFNALLVVSGVFGAFQKSAVISVGGYSSGTMGGDMDLVIKLHEYMRAKKYKYAVSFLPNSFCWTQVPESLVHLFHQRRRWQIGLIDVLGRYKKLFLNPRHGILGMIALPYYFFFEMISPIMEILGYILVPLAWYYYYLSLDEMILFFAAVVGFGIINSVGSLVVEEFTNSRHITLRGLITLIFMSIVENLFYRQLTVFFRFLGIFSYYKHKNNWGSTKRRKFAAGD